jgi:hypothetical protein
LLIKKSNADFLGTIFGVLESFLGVAFVGVLSPPDASLGVAEPNKIGCCCGFGVFFANSPTKDFFASNEFGLSLVFFTGDKLFFFVPSFNRFILFFC